MNYAQVAAAIPQTYHSTHRDLATPRPFQDPEHRQVTGRYSAGDAEPNELLFLQFFAAGDPASQELLQEHRAVVVEEVSREFGIKLPPATKTVDVVTIVTRRQPAGQYNTWVTTGDIKIRFSSPQQAKAVYVSQRGATPANRQGGSLYSFHDNPHRCTVRIPDGTDRPRPEDQDLHRVWLSSDIFRNLSQPELDIFLLDSLTDLWDRVYEANPNADQPVRPPSDFVTVLNKARQAAAQSDAQDLTLGTLDTLYILEYSRATKLGYASPFIMLEYPTSQIPLALHSLVAAPELGLNLPLGSFGPLQRARNNDFLVYDTNPTGRLLEFDDDHDRKEFLKHSIALSLRTKKEELDGLRMPALEYIAEGLELSVNNLLSKKILRKPLDRALKAADVYDLWMVNDHPNPRLNIGLNQHLGEGGIKTVGRVADADGAHQLIASYSSQAGAAISIFTHKFKLFFYRDPETGRLQLDRDSTQGNISQHGHKTIILTYETSPYIKGGLPPLKPGNRNAWVKTALQQTTLDPLPPPRQEDVDMEPRADLPPGSSHPHQQQQQEQQLHQQRLQEQQHQQRQQQITEQMIHMMQQQYQQQQEARLAAAEEQTAAEMARATAAAAAAATLQREEQRARAEDAMQENRQAAAPSQEPPLTTHDTAAAVTAAETAATSAAAAAASATAAATEAASRAAVLMGAAQADVHNQQATATAEEAATAARAAAVTAQTATAALDAATAEAEAAWSKHHSTITAEAAAAAAVTAASPFTQHIAAAAASAHHATPPTARSLRQQFSGAAGESPANHRNRAQDDRDRSRSPGHNRLPRRQGDSASTEDTDSVASPRRSSTAPTAPTGGGGEEHNSPKRTFDEEIAQLIAMMDPAQRAALLQQHQQQQQQTHSPQPQQRTSSHLQPNPSPPLDLHNPFAALDTHSLQEEPHEGGASLSQTEEGQPGGGGQEKPQDEELEDGEIS